MWYQKGRDKIISVLVGGLLLTLLWWNLREASPLRVLLRNDPSTPLFKYEHQYDDIDETARRLAPPEGNLAIGFRGDDPSNPQDQQKAARIYFRSVYELYPRRVYPLTPPDVTVSGETLLSESRPPDESVLRARNIRALAVFSRLPNGEDAVQRFQIPPTDAPAIH
jgi:hypothetical protein